MQQRLTNLEQANNPQVSFEEIRTIITSHRSSALRGVNTESILMNWEVGCYISARLRSSEWGSKIVTELSEYLRVQDPSLKGYSRRNLYNMVAFYEAYSTKSFLSLEKKYLGSKIDQIETNVSKSQIVQMSSAQLQYSQFVQFKTAQLQPPKVLVAKNLNEYCAFVVDEKI